MKMAGRKHLPFFNICVFPTLARRDGQPIEELGLYNPAPSGKEEAVRLNVERALLAGAGRQALRHRGQDFPRERPQGRPLGPQARQAPQGEKSREAGRQKARRQGRRRQAGQEAQGAHGQQQAESRPHPRQAVR